MSKYDTLLTPMNLTRPASTGIGMDTGFSSLSSTIFTTLGPLAGAFYGASSHLAHHAVRILIPKMHWFEQDNTAAKILKAITPYIVGIVAGVLVTAIIGGYPLTLGSALLIEIASFTLIGAVEAFARAIFTAFDSLTDTWIPNRHARPV